ncbi:MAG: ATP--guanido phosphotransferase [bacterium]
MNLPIDLRQSPNWARSKGPEKDVVVSSRLRFARNDSRYPFPGRANGQQKDEVFQRTEEILTSADTGRELHFLRMSDLESLEKDVIRERRLGSKKLTEAPHGGLVFDPGESTAVLVNEEDHFRIQSLSSGYNLTVVRNAAERFEDALGERIDFAYDEQWGYLTACPTNLGTGLRASVLLHLPGLILRDDISQVLKAIANLGLTVRGYYGEGTESQGFYLQLSNQVTLGQSVDDLIDSLSRVTERLISKERKARDELFSQDEVEVQDKIWRAYGVLKHSRKLGMDESLKLLSFCRLGIDAGLIDEIELTDIDELFIKIQPAHLNQIVGSRLSNADRQAFRSTIIRKLFADSQEDNPDVSTNTLEAELSDE